MKRPIAILTFALATLSPCIPGADAAVVHRSGEGWTSEAEDGGAAEGSAGAQLRKAQELEASGDLKRAIGAYRTLVRTWPDARAAAQAQIKIGDLYLALGNLDRSFEAYGKYISTHPEGQEFEQAVDAQFRIANSFLQGERRRVFGIKTFPSMQRAHDMFAEIVKNAPFSKVAPMAQFNAGQALERQGKVKEAVDAYQEVVTRYPLDDIAADAMYQIGYIYFEATKTGSNDPGAVQKAREAFEDFILRYPQSEKVAQANENLVFLAGDDAKKVLDIGKFYQKTGKLKAAVIYYEEVIASAGGTPEAEEARKRIDDLRAKVGEDALRAGPERADTGARAKERRKLQAQVETASRPDYAGPPVPRPAVEPDEVAPEGPRLRSPRGIVEPTLPSGPAPADTQSLAPEAAPQTPAPEETAAPAEPATGE